MITKTENCVVRTFRRGYTNSTTQLEEKLRSGWIVKSSTPMIRDGDTECVEYILERESREFREGE